MSERSLFCPLPLGFNFSHVWVIMSIFPFPTRMQWGLVELSTAAGTWTVFRYSWLKRCSASSNLPSLLCFQKWGWVLALRANWTTVFQLKFVKSFSFTANQSSVLCVPVQIYLLSCKARTYLPSLRGWYLFPSHCSPNYTHTCKFHRTLGSSSFFDSLLFVSVKNYLWLESHGCTYLYLSYSHVNALSLLLEFLKKKTFYVFLLRLIFWW